MKAQAAAGAGVEADELLALTEAVLRQASARGWMIATAESCTGGLLASLLTDVEGYGKAFDRGLVVYTVEAKVELLGLERSLIERHGAVSEPVARAMAQGAIARSDAQLAAAITGFAGPAGPRDEQGLVHIAVSARDGGAWHRACQFGQRCREETRSLAARGALELLAEALGPAEPVSAGARR